MSTDLWYVKDGAYYIVRKGRHPKACAGCGRAGVLHENVPPGQVALHWHVREAWVCVDCYQKEKLAPVSREPMPSRDEFIRALANMIEAYDRETVYGHRTDRDAAAFALDEAHVAEARKLLALVLPRSDRRST